MEERYLLQFFSAYGIRMGRAMSASSVLNFLYLYLLLDENLEILLHNLLRHGDCLVGLPFALRLLLLIFSYFI